MKCTIKENFLHRSREDNLYTTNSFEVTALHGGENLRNTMTRMVNSLVSALNTMNVLPKWLIVVPEDDLIKNLKFEEYGVSEAYGRIIDWIMVEHNKALTRMKGFLPHKTKKHQWPLILWIIPTLHTNYDNFELRKKFARSLRIAANNNNVAVLPLRQVWKIYDKNVYSRSQQRYITSGLPILWTAIDRTIKFADQRITRNYGKALHELFPNDVDEEADIHKNPPQDERLEYWECMKLRQQGNKENNPPAVPKILSQNERHAPRGRYHRMNNQNDSKDDRDKRYNSSTPRRHHHPDSRKRLQYDF